MKTFLLIRYLLVLCLSVAFLSSAALAAEKLPHPDTYLPDPFEAMKRKAAVDDSRDLVAEWPFKKALPPEVYNQMTFDVDEAKRQTEEILGFKSPDLVGKIAPEIKPGKYTYEDLEKFPGLKELFPPELVKHIKPGGPPLIGNIPEFEIIPTRQLYWYLQFCELTQKNLGKTKLDKDGYIDPRSWEGGVPFPRPSGKSKAQEVYYNFEKRASFYDYCGASQGNSDAYNRNLKRDSAGAFVAAYVKLKARCLFPPYGWLDKRAERNNERRSMSYTALEPRSSRGTVFVQLYYDDPYKMDPSMVYVPSLRRIRQMATTDTQDPLGDMTYDDRDFLSQKITPIKYPYKFETSEREFLIPIAWNKSDVYFDSKDGYAFKNVEFMRRPCYVLQMTQLDPNYTYSKRIFYIDKETFQTGFSANYDQNGRLYRSQAYVETLFLPDVGMLAAYGTYYVQWDHLDYHSSMQLGQPLPAPYSRKRVGLKQLIRKGK